MTSHMQDKVCIVTGATAGIGLITARELARMGATVVGIGRNPAKCASAVEEIRRTAGNPNVEFLLADLSAQVQVRRVAEEFLGKYSRLDVLVNNAGAFYNSRQESVDGIELTLALNHFSYFLLTELLLDRLLDSAPARIVNVSSDAHRMGKGFNFDDPEFKQRRYNGWTAYSQSKLANVLFTYELARRLEGSDVTANALHPGFVATQFAHNNGFFFSLLMRLIQGVGGRSPEEGAATSIYLASSSEVEGVTGKYFVDKRPVESLPASYDVEAAKRLWAWSEALCQSQLGVARAKSIG